MARPNKYDSAPSAPEPLLDHLEQLLDADSRDAAAYSAAFESFPLKYKCRDLYYGEPSSTLPEERLAYLNRRAAITKNLAALEALSSHSRYSDLAMLDPLELCIENYFYKGALLLYEMGLKSSLAKHGSHLCNVKHWSSMRWPKEGLQSLLPIKNFRENFMFGPAAIKQCSNADNLIYNFQLVNHIMGRTVDTGWIILSSTITSKASNLQSRDRAKLIIYARRLGYEPEECDIAQLARNYPDDQLSHQAMTEPLPAVCQQ